MFPLKMAALSTMRRGPQRMLAGAVCLAILAGCVTPPVEVPAFDAAALAARADDDAVDIVGWYDRDHNRLYSTRSALKRTDASFCVDLRLLSLAGVPTPDMQARRVAISGHVVRAADAACATGLRVEVSDLTIAPPG